MVGGGEGRGGVLDGRGWGIGVSYVIFDGSIYFWWVSYNGKHNRITSYSKLRDPILPPLSQNRGFLRDLSVDGGLGMAVGLLQPYCILPFSFQGGQGRADAVYFLWGIPSRLVVVFLLFFCWGAGHSGRF